MYLKSNPVILFLIFMAGIACYVMEIPVGITICEFLIAFFIVKDSIGKDLEDCDLVFFYALFSMVVIIGNFMVLYTIDTPLENKYNYYLSKNYINDAAMISFVGFCSLIIGYSSRLTLFGDFKLTGVINTSLLDKVFLVISLYYVQWFFTHIEIPFLNYLTYPFLLLQAKVALSENKHQKTMSILILVIMMSVKGLLYAYRRQEAFEPFVILFVAIFIANKGDWRKLFAFKYVVMMFMVVVMVSQFDSMQKIRSSQGMDRWNEWLKLNKDDGMAANDFFDETDENESEKNILARSSTMNQLSQVVELQKEEGFYNGSTLSYIAFAFVPRFIWPEKPLIMQGRWFANEIGMAYNHGTTGSLQDINNSINMTVAGELYLNFNYFGVIIGMGFLGVLFRGAWKMSNFYDNGNNLPGTILGLFLIAVIYFYVQVDMQFIVNFVQVILVTIGINALLKLSESESE